jgi:hypothetical protein
MNGCVKTPYKHVDAWHSRVYFIGMICGARSLLLCFVLIFVAGVMCSVVCPERDIIPHENHDERGPCTECTSTDFVAGAKISTESIRHQATIGFEIDLFITLAPINDSVLVSTGDECAPASPPLLEVNRILRV